MHGRLCCRKGFLAADSIVPAFPVVLKIHPDGFDTCSQVTDGWKGG